MLGDAYAVRLTRAAEKDLDAKQFLGWQAQVIDELLALEREPTRGHALRGSLKGARALEFSHAGVLYRAVYVVLDDERVCLVFLIGSHENVYREAARRAARLRKPK
jgi:mRNA-degrading endonuclease RelE of RelBE toxin-antitoxin system